MLAGIACGGAPDLHYAVEGHNRRNKVVLMQSDIVAQGLELMVYGMGSVVVFLALLVVCMTLMSTTITRFFPEPQVVRQTSRKPTPAAQDEELVAVISAAVHQHRRR
ncbi:MAG: OadG family transporter subunit [Halioglobus sp.]